MYLKTLCDFPLLNREVVTQTLFTMESFILKKNDSLSPTVKTILMAMKLTAIILLSVCLTANAEGFSQINLSETNTPLHKVFKKIKKQSGYNFLFRYELLEEAGTVTVKLHNVSLQQAIQEVLKGKALTFEVIDNTVIIKKKENVVAREKSALPVRAQQFIVSGRVTSAEEGKPLQGVSVTSSSLKNGVITDINGKYNVDLINGNASLQFSYVGYLTQIVEVRNRPVIDVQMAVSNKELSEVVITAFGIEKQKKSLGYSSQVVKGEELTEARETNVANSLKGKVAGVFVSPSNTGAGGSTYIDIRGSSSLRGNNQPLYVVDGVPIDNQTIDAPGLFNDKGINRDYGDGIGNILPDDIENMTVLKGPNAAALYGSRGANGVILITTKKGKAGKRAGVDFNSNATFETPNVLPQYQRVWGPGYDDNYGAMFYDSATVGGKKYPLYPSWLSDTWGGKYDGRDVVLEMWPAAGVLKYSPTGEDNIRKFYRTGSTVTNTIGVSGGTDKSNYRLSVSDLHNTGIIPSSKFNRQTINLRAGFNATNNLYVEGKINYIRQHGENRPSNGLDINTLPWSLNRIPAFVDLDLLKNYKTPDGQSNNWADGRPFNPYWIINEMPSNDSRDRIIGYVMARYKFTSWLTLQARSGTDFYTDIRHSHIAVNTPTSSLRDGEVMSNEIHVKEENSDVLLTASGKLTEKFTGTFSVGANHLNRREEITGVEGYNLNIPGIYNIINARLVFPRNTLERKQINSAYFAGQIGYKNFLYLDVTGRNDWSSTLGVSNYSFFYPSVSSSFVFSDAFKMNTGILSFGKVRLSYAQAGNDADPYRTQIGYNLLSSSFNGQQFASAQGDVPLLDLKNELSTSVEVGTELRFLKNRIGIDFTYYNASTKNQILPIDVSAGTGFTTKLINAGEIKNHGIEILLNATPIKSKSFSWDVAINFSRNRSKVASLAPGVDNLLLLSSDEVSIEARPGMPYGNLVGYAFKRNVNGDKWLTDAGVYQQEDSLSVLGNIQPDFLGGITNAISFKGFTLSALVDIRTGGEIFSYSKQEQMYSGTGKFTENGDNLISDGVIQDADGKFNRSTIVVGRMNYYTSMGWGNIGEASVIPADYVSLREVSLGYDIGRLLHKTAFKTAKLSVVARNLFYIYRDPQFKLMGVAPEGAYGPSTTAQGYESPGAPSTRSVGLNLSFSL